MPVHLVTGAIRSGKSRFAEHLLIDQPDVTYVAPHPPGDGELDPEWAQRVARHRAARPPHWQTIETLDLAPLMRQDGGALIIDCLGTWLTGLVDRAGLWEDRLAAQRLLERERAELVDAVAQTRRLVVAVTNEVGWSLVADNPAGRLFQDELGRLNASVAACTDLVYLVVAGRVIELGPNQRVPAQDGPMREADAGLVDQGRSKC